MGLMDKICDKVVDAASSCETIRMPYEELAKIVEREFISGADDLFLSKVQKTAKGGFAITKQLKSANSRFDFHVGARPNGCVWLPSKPVWILDHEYNKFYQLDKNIKWKKFYNAVAESVNREKTNRNI